MVQVHLKGILDSDMGFAYQLCDSRQVIKSLSEPQFSHPSFGIKQYLWQMSVKHEQGHIRRALSTVLAHTVK